MKQHGNYSITEQKEMFPYEWELYYYQTVNDFKIREEERKRLEALNNSLR